MEYPTPPLMDIKPHPLIFDTPERKALEQEFGDRPPTFSNFASHYHVKLLRDKRQMAIVDRTTGIIYPSPFATATDPFALPPSNWDPERPQFLPISNLLGIPNVCPQGPNSCASFYFLWENNKFRLLESIPVSAVPIIPTISPLVGKWTGRWSYTDGMEEFAESFTLEFTDRAGKLTGLYASFKTKPARKFRITEITATKIDKSTYRMNVGNECWNVSVQGDKLQGVRNGGPCAPSGIGPGARLVALEATRNP